MIIPDTLKQLLAKLADGRFHSGTELSAESGISRSAIWKQLQALAELGVELTAVTGKGYKLNRPMQLLDRQQVVDNLSDQAGRLLRSLEIHDVIDSTNSHLLERARTGEASGLVCVTESQTAGKGRRGRAWVSPFGHNIYLSMLWRYQDGPAALTGLSLALGVAAVRALQQLGIQDVGLKWPNDIYWRQQKLAGILVEVSGETGGPCVAVAGLGLNFYLSTQQVQDIDQPCIHVSAILGDTAYLRRNELLALLLNQLLPVLAGYETGHIRDYLDEWRSYDCMLGTEVNLFVGQQQYVGTVAGIDQDGLLLLRSSDGQLRTFASGEVSFRTA